MKIQLPPLGQRESAEANDYPFRIGLQTQKFMQAAIFLTAFQDEAAGLTVRSPGGVRRVEEKLGLGADSRVAADAWKYLGDFKPVLSKHVFQNTLITMRSHWDWYVSRLGSFVEFGREHVPGPSLSKQEQRSLGRIGFRPIDEQTEILAKASGTTFTFKPKTIELAREMSMVRNLGVHNRWEVDSYYSENTQTDRNWELGELRYFDRDELGTWHSAIIDLIHATTIEVAKTYRDAPEFKLHPGEHKV